MNTVIFHEPPDRDQRKIGEDETPYPESPEEAETFLIRIREAPMSHEDARLKSHVWKALKGMPASRVQKWRWPSLVRRKTANLMSQKDPGVRIPLSTPFLHLATISIISRRVKPSQISQIDIDDCRTCNHSRIVRTHRDCRHPIRPPTSSWSEPSKKKKVHQDTLAWMRRSSSEAKPDLSSI